MRFLLGGTGGAGDKKEQNPDFNSSQTHEPKNRDGDQLKALNDAKLRRYANNDAHPEGETSDLRKCLFLAVFRVFS